MTSLTTAIVAGQAGHVTDHVEIANSLNALAVPNGVAGRSYSFVGGVIRNSGSPDYWQTIEDAQHRSQNVDSVSTDTNQITISYAGIAAERVVSFTIVTDETLAQAGFFVGASVGLTQCLVKLERTRSISAQIAYGGTSWTVSQPSAPSAGISVTTFNSGLLTVAHDDLGASGVNDVSLTPRGHLLRPVLTTATGAASSTGFKVEFYDLTSNSLQNTESTNMRFFVKRAQSANINPQTVDTTAFPNSNLWFLGVFET